MNYRRWWYRCCKSGAKIGFDFERRSIAIPVHKLNAYAVWACPTPPKCFCTLLRILYKRSTPMLCTSIGDVMATPLFESLLHAPRRSKRSFRSYIYTLEVNTDSPTFEYKNRNWFFKLLQASYTFCGSENGLSDLLQASYTHYAVVKANPQNYKPPTCFS